MNASCDDGANCSVVLPGLSIRNLVFVIVVAFLAGSFDDIVKVLPPQHHAHRKRPRIPVLFVVGGGEFADGAVFVIRVCFDVGL